MAHKRNLLSLLPKIDPDISENVRLEAVPGGFVNLTDLAVSDQVAALLSYGPKFLSPDDISVLSVFSHFGEIHVQVEHHLGLGITGPIFLELLETYKDEKDKLFAIRQPSLIEVALRQAVAETKAFFRRFTHACIVQSDKGNKTCLMLLSDYQEKMAAYVTKCVAKGVYQLTTSRRVDAATNIFRGFRAAILASSPSQGDMELTKLCDRLRQFGTARLPYLYGNVKCHKQDAPIRPICSTVAWYSRPIQKMLNYILKRYFNEALFRQNVRCIDDVAKTVATIQPRSGYIFTKLDVTNMYGSMDKDRIIKLLDRLLETIDAEGRSLLPKDIVRRMIRFSYQTVKL